MHAGAEASRGTFPLLALRPSAGILHLSLTRDTYQRLVRLRTHRCSERWATSRSTGEVSCIPPTRSGECAPQPAQGVTGAQAPGGKYLAELSLASRNFAPGRRFYERVTELLSKNGARTSSTSCSAPSPSARWQNQLNSRAPLHPRTFRSARPAALPLRPLLALRRAPPHRVPPEREGAPAPGAARRPPPVGALAAAPGRALRGRGGGGGGGGVGHGAPLVRSRVARGRGVRGARCAAAAQQPGVRCRTHLPCTHAAPIPLLCCDWMRRVSRGGREALAHGRLGPASPRRRRDLRAVFRRRAPAPGVTCLGANVETYQTLRARMASRRLPLSDGIRVSAALAPTEGVALEAGWAELHRWEGLLCPEQVWSAVEFAASRVRGGHVPWAAVSAWSWRRAAVARHARRAPQNEGGGDGGVAARGGGGAGPASSRPAAAPGMYQHAGGASDLCVVLLPKERYLVFKMREEEKRQRAAFPGGGGAAMKGLARAAGGGEGALASGGGGR